MNNSLTADQINMMNSILDKELDILKENSFADGPHHNRENSGQILRTKDLTSSTEHTAYKTSSPKLHRVDSNQGYSFQKENSSYSSSTYRNRNNNRGEEPSERSLKVQDDLLDLQNKILNMEKKLLQMSSLNSPPKPTHQNSRALINKDVTKFSPENVDSQNSTPMRRKYQEELTQSQRTTVIRDSAMNKTNSAQKKIQFQDQASESEEESFRQHEPSKKGGVKSPGKRLNKFLLEQEIKGEQIKLEKSKSRLKRSSSKVSNKSISARGSPNSSRGMSYRTRTNESFQTNEIQVLNKKMQTLKKKNDESKSLLIKERLRNQELLQQNEKFAKKLKKSQIELEKYQKLDNDYQRLLESFEKSEFIRNQQKQLIASLNEEIENLKGSLQSEDILSHTARKSGQLKKRKSSKKRKIY